MAKYKTISNCPKTFSGKHYFEQKLFNRPQGSLYIPELMLRCCACGFVDDRNKAKK